MIIIQDLCKSYRDKAVLQDISLRVEDGSIYGLVGYNGAGKTTLLSLIAGLLRPDKGSIVADIGEGEGARAVSTFDKADLHRELYYIQDEPYVLPGASLHTMGAFYRGFYPHFSMELFDRLIHIFGLDPRARIAGFSKGMKRQAAILLGLSARPRYLLLDESFDGLDPSVRGVVCDLLLEYMADTGASVIMASHDLSTIEHICDTVGMLNGNRLIYSANLEELRARYVRIRAAFGSPVTEAVLDGIPHGELQLHGPVLTAIVESDTVTLEASLRFRADLRLLECTPLSLTEIFTYEYRQSKGGLPHDFEGLFTLIDDETAV